MLARGVLAGVLEVAGDHLAHREQLLGGDPDLAVHLLEELHQPRAVGDALDLEAVGVARVHGAVGERVGLADQVDHVHAEAVDAPVDPPAHHRVHGLPDLGVLPVEVGLLAAEQVQVVLPRRLVELPPRAAEERAPVGGLGSGRPRCEALPRRAPDVPVPLGRGRVARLDEPRVLVGGVVDHQVHHQLHPAGVDGLGQLVDVGQRAEHRVDRLVVGDVVAVVVLGGGEDRREPHHVDAEPGDVVEVVDDAPDVAVPVPVAVGEGAWVHLVDDGAGPPRSRRVHDAILVFRDENSQ